VIIKVGNRSIIKAEKVGKLRIYVLQSYGRKFKILLENVKLCLIIGSTYSELTRI
jgi:hypothetical protein